MRLYGINLVIRLVCILAISFFTAACGSSARPGIGPVIRELVVARSYLASGEMDTFPTTVRMSLWISDIALPVDSATIDIDGDGPQQPINADVRFFGKLDPQDGGTTYYFDFAWDGPDDTMSQVTVNTAAGTYSENVTLRLDWLAEWPY